MQAQNIAALLVKPAACVIDQPGGIERADLFAYRERVELPPAFIKWNPDDDAGMVVQKGDGFCDFAPEFVFSLGMEPGEQTGVLFIVGKRNMIPVHQSRQIGDEPVLIGGTAVYHVLPDEHAQLVAVVVKTLGLDFCVLAQHVEAELLHPRNIGGQRFVRRCGVETFRPVALIQYARLDIRFIV